MLALSCSRRRESSSASLIRRALRAPPPLRYRFWRDGRDPSAGLTGSSGEDGTESTGDIPSPMSRVDHLSAAAAARDSSASFWSYRTSCSASDRLRMPSVSVSPRRKLDRRGDGLTLGLTSELPGVLGLLEYGEDVGEFGRDAIEWSKLVAGEEGLDCIGLSLRLFGRGGGGRPPPACGREGTAWGEMYVSICARQLESNAVPIIGTGDACGGSKQQRSDGSERT
ncbi:hypothetical protein C8Q70DRAFT_58808 [Cubamyces menziesii]|nr:hypothetical protein C8Q70DRAFT_58808 [Cubamyces menziesii]